MGWQRKRRRSNDVDAVTAILVVGRTILVMGPVPAAVHIGKIILEQDLQTGCADGAIGTIGTSGGGLGNDDHRRLRRGGGGILLMPQARATRTRTARPKYTFLFIISPWKIKIELISGV